MWFRCKCFENLFLIKRKIREKKKSHSTVNADVCRSKHDIHFHLFKENLSLKDKIVILVDRVLFFTIKLYFRQSNTFEFYTTFFYWKLVSISIYFGYSETPTRWCSVKKLYLKFFKFKGKHLCWIHFIKKRLQHRWFHMDFPNFLRTAFFTEHLWGLGLVFDTLILNWYFLK